MKIISEKTKYHRFSLYYDYSQDRVDFCKQLKESFGWQKFSFAVDGELKRWVFSDSILIPVLKERFPETMVDSEVDQIVKDEQIWTRDQREKEEKIDIIKEKKETNFAIKGLKMNMYDYQKVGTEFLFASGGRAIIADAPGLGKTIQALAYVHHMQYKRTLVVCPASVKFSWENEVAKWLPDSFSSYIISGKPTSNAVNSLMSFLAFDSHVGKNSGKKGNNIHSGLNGPAILSQFGRKIHSFKDPNILPTSKSAEPVDKRFIGVINNQAPANSSFGSQGGGNASLPIDDASKVGEFNHRDGGSDGNSLPFSPTDSQSRGISSKTVGGDTHNLSAFTIRQTALQKTESLSFHSRGPNKLISGIHKVIVINYDILSKWQPIFKILNIECLIGDECQLVKTVTTIRTKAFRSISKDIPSVILLSGTPLLSRPSELFSLLNIVDSKTWDNWYHFVRRYCNMHQTRWGMDISGASNVEELHARIRRYFIRRDKTEVLKELPPKTFINVPVELEREYASQYDLAAGSLAKYLREYQDKEGVEIERALAAEKLTQLNVLRQLNAMGKVKTAIELIESVLDSGEKVLVFCSFVGPLQKLKEHFGNKSVILTGQTPVNDRKLIVETFQKDNSVSVFLGGIKSAGVGITLTAASNVIFLDYSWNPADHQQAQDRVHRPGQVAESVNIYQLSARNTIDEDLKKMLDHKQGIFDRVIDGKTIEKSARSTNEAMESAVERILNDYPKE